MVHRIPVPSSLHDALPGAGYADAFTVPAIGRDALGWARATFDAPELVRAGVWWGWRLVLGMQLGPRSDAEHVFGWRIASAEPGRVVLAVHARLLGDARLVFSIDDAHATIGTLLRFDHRWARPAWRAIGVVHRLTMRYLIGHASRAKS